MVAKLVIEEGDSKGLSLSLEDRESWAIGSDSNESQLTLENPLIAPKHLLIRRTDEGMVVQNLSEDHPAQLNDEEINEQNHLLQNGDTLKVGNEVFRYYEDSSARVIDEDLPALEDEDLNEENVGLASTNDENQESSHEKEKEEVEVSISNEPEEKESSATVAGKEIFETLESITGIVTPPVEKETQELSAEKETSSSGEDSIIKNELPEEENNVIKSSGEENDVEIFESIGRESDKAPVTSSEEGSPPETNDNESSSSPEAAPDESPELPQEENAQINEFNEGEELAKEQNFNDMNLPAEDPETPTNVPAPKEESEIEEPPRQDTVLGEEEDISLANIDFGVIETGRWLLKVIGGPNNGAEFYMQAGNSYIVGTDPRNCDIVFHDTSVSRQHARITVSPEDTLSVEDLKSRNGVLVNGTAIEGAQELPPGTIVTVGTTSFVVYDREGEMQTIVSPLLPSIVKILQGEKPKAEGSEEDEASQEVKTTEPARVEAASAPAPEVVQEPVKKEGQFGPYIVLTAIIGLFVIAGIGTTTLFRDEPIVIQSNENADAMIKQTLESFPAVRWTYNKANGSLLLLGHVSTLDEKNQLLYNLGTLKFLKSVDDTGIVIDEGVWNEINSLLDHNPTWKGISVHSPEAGQFVLSGELATRRQAEQLSSYLNLNFPYLDLLTSKIVIDEDVVNEVQGWLQAARMPDVSVSMSNGAVSLDGAVAPEQLSQLDEIVGKIKQIPGVRAVNKSVESHSAETGVINLSDQYSITGKSRVGSNYTVVINGRILSVGDELDGMIIKEINSNHIYLERGKEKYRIDY